MSVTISEAVKYIGVDDKTIDLFESQYVVPHGVSYNSYLIFDEKVALMDTVDARGMEQWEKNLLAALDGRNVDYLKCLGISHRRVLFRSESELLPGKALPDVRYFRHDPAPDGKQPDNPLSVRLMRPADFSPTAPHLWCLPYPSKLPFHPKSDKNYKIHHAEPHTGSRTGQSSFIYSDILYCF